MDEGYIKFKAEWTQAPALPFDRLARLDHWRRKLYSLGLIGSYPDGIGYGNLSCRWDKPGQFAITGSATGNLPELDSRHYSLVTAVDLTQNRLWCQGPIVASSESMSHAVIYRECPQVMGVVHVHHLRLWEQLLHRVPTTDPSAAYGTPEMARSIIRLLQETNLPEQRIFVMEGHREGIFAFGKNLDDAGEVLLRHFHELT